MDHIAIIAKKPHPALSRLTTVTTAEGQRSISHHLSLLA